MPELPEVEAARRAIEEHCIGKKIAKSIIANDAKVIDGVSPSDFETSLLNKTIVAAHRKGKNMWLQLDSPPFPSFQFGMSGAIYIKGVAVTKYKRSAVNDTDEWPSKYSKVFIELDDGLEMSFTDKRRFAKVRLLDDPASVPPISELGPDALLEPMSVDELYSSLRKKKLGIKALLLDQSFVSGVGNWIADEVLYQARIHPMQIASTLSKESCATLDRCIKEVIGKAVEVGAVSSQYPSNWIFHSREKKPGKAFVNGKKIDFINAGGRTTAYVPELQKLSVTEASKAFTKTSKRTSRRDKDEDSGDTDNHDANEPESEKDAEKENSKQQDTKNDKKGKKPPRSKKSMRIDENDVEHKKETGSRGKMVPSKRNSKGSPDDDVAAKQRKKPRVESKKVITHTKSKANSGSKGGSGDDDASDGNVDEKKSSKGTKGKQPKDGNSSKRKADTDHNGKQTKKKAK